MPSDASENRLRVWRDAEPNVRAASPTHQFLNQFRVWSAHQYLIDSYVPPETLSILKQRALDHHQYIAHPRYLSDYPDLWRQLSCCLVCPRRKKNTDPRRCSGVRIALNAVWTALVSSAIEDVMIKLLIRKAVITIHS